MNEKPKTRAKPALPNPPQIVEADFISPDGVPSKVLIPAGEKDLSKGIPVSLDLSGLYAHMPDAFLKELTSALHAVGLVKPADYFAPDAPNRFRAAMLSVIKRDFLNAIALAKEELDTRK